MLAILSILFICYVTATMATRRIEPCPYKPVSQTTRIIGSDGFLEPAQFKSKQTLLLFNIC
jgi:hypothetical protein